MTNRDQDWDDWGRDIQELIDRAVHSHNFQKLNQTVCQVVGKVVDLGSEAVRNAVDSSSHIAPKTQNSTPQASNRKISREPSRLPVLYGRTGKQTSIGIVKTVGGGLLSMAAALALIPSAVLHAIRGTAWLSMGSVLMLACLAGGVWLIASGASTLGRISRFRIYRRTLGQQTHCTLERLARSVGKRIGYVRKELRRMTEEGLFLEGHLDREEKNFITSDETYRHYEQSRLELEQRQKQAAAAPVEEAPASPVQEVLDRGDAFLAEIRRCNDAIPGEEISGKISRIELIVQRIFERAESHPEIVPDLKRMMDYYLPMTVKLLRAYAEMDAQPVQGETIQSSKREIEATMDTLNRAFEKLLDSVFQDTAMDVSSDISVLHTLLAQEGLTEDEWAKIKKAE